MAPSFSLPKSLKRSRRSGPVSAGAFQPVSTPERRPYGTSHLFIAPQVDLYTPGGRYRQSTNAPPFTPRVDDSNGGPISFQSTPCTPPRPRRDHRPAQWRSWTTLVIPRLIPVWLELLRVSEGLRNVPREVDSCDCLSTIRKLRITLVSLDRISSVMVCVCQAPQSLLRIGYLVSAPIRPTYAFDVQMLDFMRLLHQRTAPNKSAWSASLEMFLWARGHAIRGKDVIRRKLAASLKWFIYLRAETEFILRKAILNPSTTAEDDGDTFWEDISPGEGLEGLEYLAWRCPLGFGDADALGKLLFDFIVCLDACFTQKRRNPVRGKGSDPPLKHPSSVFLTPEEIAAAEKLVNDARPARQVPQPATSTEADMVEVGMKLPKSVLDACLESFTVADEKWGKASTKFFADTSLMVMLCRHDQVLWLANMTTAGEHQYYAIALIIKLFKYLPENATVGLLYDIGCQLEHSIVKWGFIPELRGRISWAVSVFHAYGHQWPCQLVYHPRKREGFGLSDGEGCERLWSSLDFLIPTLHVSGFHQRVFTLDTQVAFETDQRRRTLGEWTLRKFKAVQSKRREALLDGLANKCLKVILTLMDLSMALGQEIAGVSRKLTQNISIEKLEELIEMRIHLTEQKTGIDTQVESKRNALGLSERQDLRSLLNDKYLQTRMKALAVKERLRARVQDRKFELERVDKAYSQTTASDSCLHTHIKSQVARHQPNIVNLMKKYNSLCSDLEILIREGKATPGARPPRKIEANEVYSLDVDAPIWDDQGLNDGVAGPIPLWLGNEEVRMGIRSWLGAQRCDEELGRLRMECNSMRVWAVRETSLLHNALEVIGDPDVLYQLEAKNREINDLISSWKQCIRTLSPSVAAADWGTCPQAFHGDAVISTPGEGAIGEYGEQTEVEEEAEAEDDSWDSEDGELEAEDKVLQEMELMKMSLVGGDESDSDEGWTTRLCTTPSRSIPDGVTLLM